MILEIQILWLAALIQSKPISLRDFPLSVQKQNWNTQFDLKTVLDLYHIKRIDIEGCIISSVVPQITNAVKLAAEKVLKKEPMVLGPGVKTGLNILMDNPDSLEQIL